MVSDYLILCLAAALGGAVNAIAGGGTLLTFPALYTILGATPEASVLANATSTVALVPGSVAALLGYRREIKDQRFWALMLLGPSLIGGLIGSLLVVALPAKVFDEAVPWLILTAALLFALQPTIARLTGIGAEQTGLPSPRLITAAVIFQFLVAIYGGYFGAGIGILMLSSLAMIGLGDIHRMNAVKTLLAAIINGTSVLIFSWEDKVVWPYAVAMAIAASIGGYLGAHTARRFDKTVVRRVVVTIGFSLASYYFYRQFMGE